MDNMKKVILKNRSSFILNDKDAYNLVLAMERNGSNTGVEVLFEKEKSANEMILMIDLEDVSAIISM